jgi:hypothetical protein
MASKEYRIIGNMYHHQVTRIIHAPLSTTTCYHYHRITVPRPESAHALASPCSSITFPINENQ